MACAKRKSFGEAGEGETPLAASFSVANPTHC